MEEKRPTDANNAPPDPVPATTQNKIAPVNKSIDSQMISNQYPLQADGLPLNPPVVNTLKDNPDKPCSTPQDMNGTTPKIEEYNKSRIRKKGKICFNYSVGREDFIKQKLELWEIRDKYGLKSYQHKYLIQKSNDEGWKVKRSEYWDKRGIDADEAIEESRQNEVKSINVFLKNMLKRLESDALPIKTTSELVNVIDTITKLRELLMGNSTDRIDLTTNKRMIMALIQKVS